MLSPRGCVGRGRLNPRFADASIMPVILSAHTIAPGVIIAIDGDTAAVAGPPAA